MKAKYFVPGFRTCMKHPCVALLYVRIILELLSQRINQFSDFIHYTANSGDFAERSSSLRGTKQSVHIILNRLHVIAQIASEASQ